LQAAANGKQVLLTADADFGALLALGSLASPSVLLLRSADHLRPVEQAELISANLPSISEDLERVRSRTWLGIVCASASFQLRERGSGEQGLWWVEEADSAGTETPVTALSAMRELR
jgi:hypothetical protein